jgi:hypothetical protein
MVCGDSPGRAEAPSWLKLRRGTRGATFYHLNSSPREFANLVQAGVQYT